MDIRRTDGDGEDKDEHPRQQLSFTSFDHLVSVKASVCLAPQGLDGPRVENRGAGLDISAS